MEITLENFMAFGVGVSLTLVAVMFFKRKSSGDGFFSKVFQSNKDFDSTLDRITLSVIILTLILCFQDGVQSHFDMIFTGFFMVYKDVVHNKQISDLKNGQTSNTSS